MAEIAVWAALALVQIVSPLIENLDSQRNGRKMDIKNMQSWLSTMKAFLEDNCGHEGGSMLEDQKNKVRDIAYNIEDFLEEIVLHSPPYAFHDHKIIRQIHNFAHQVHHGFPLHAIFKKSEEINHAIEIIIAQLPFRDLNPQTSSSSSGTSTINHTVSPLLLDDEMVGYEKPKTEFMRQLFDREKGLLRLAVNGPVGSGKTKFVMNVFSNKETKRRFDCHAWVHVSRSCDVKELLANILKQLCGSRYAGEDNGSTMSKMLIKYLSGKKYIVVLDDVWKKDHWDYINNALPDANRRSRIIITTRSSNLASTCASSSQHVYKLEKLDCPEGWKLFCRKAFPEIKGECPVDLKDSSVKIVKRCEGLPLAIVAVAGALKNKRRLPIEWERFHNNLGDEIRSGSNLCVIDIALMPSYMDLSTNLKCCFLYFSIFPEGCSVNRNRLIRLWVAERFAMKTDYKTAEEVAEEYLNELIQRNLVHVSDWDLDGRPKNCRVLNLILEFIIQKCKDDNFVSIFPREIKSENKKIRRLSVHNHKDYTHFPDHEDSDFCGVRSMILLSKPAPADFEKDLCKRKFLRVLEVQGAPLIKFPKDIARLTLLKLLSFRNTKIKVIPKSIKNLSYLETLDLKQTDVTELPKEISFLRKLCHLFVYKIDSVEGDDDKFNSVKGAKVYEGIDNLTKLQELTLVKLGQNGRILQDMKKLTLLRKLGLVGLKREHGKHLCAAIELMKNLTTLDLRAATKEEFLEVGEMTNPPKTLQRLYLKGRLKEFPRWISSINNLLRIRLMWSKMDKSPLQALEGLPHLMELHLLDCCIEQELTFKALGFKELKRLEIEGLTKLRAIVIQNGAMPQLKKVSIRRCPQMKTCPPSLKYLTKLQELTLCDMAEEFVDRLRINGKDRKWVQRVPVIHSFNGQTRSSENLNSVCFSN